MPTLGFLMTACQGYLVLEVKYSLTRRLTRRKPLISLVGIDALTRCLLRGVSRVVRVVTRVTLQGLCRAS